MSKPPVAAEKPGSQGLSVSVSQGEQTQPRPSLLWRFMSLTPTSVSSALDARLEVGLEQQAELMLKMMATLQADSILQALTASSSTGLLGVEDRSQGTVGPRCGVSLKALLSDFQ